MRRCGRLFALAARSQRETIVNTPVEQMQLAPAVTAAFVASGSRWFNATAIVKAADPAPVPLSKLKVGVVAEYPLTVPPS